MTTMAAGGSEGRADEAGRNPATPGRYDLALLLLAVGFLLALGLVALGGTGYAYLVSLSEPQWSETPLYEAYLRRMNALAYPLVAGLLLTLALCIPRRLLRRRTLALASAAVLAAGAGAGLAWGPRSGLAALLLAGALLQTVVLAATIRRTGALVWQREGQAARLGSALLHLGFVLFVLTVVGEAPGRLFGLSWAGQPPGIFGAAATLMTTGVVLAFWPDALTGFAARLRRGGGPPTPPGGTTASPDA